MKYQICSVCPDLSYSTHFTPPQHAACQFLGIRVPLGHFPHPTGNLSQDGTLPDSHQCGQGVWGGCSGVLGVILQLPDFPSCRKSLGICPHPKGAAPDAPWLELVCGARCPRAQPLSQNPPLVRPSPGTSSARMEISGELNGWRILALIPLQVLREGEVHWLSILPCCDKSLRSCFAAPTARNML